MYIAQLTGGIVTSVTQTNGIATDANHIEIGSFDVSLLGCSYADGVFTPPAAVPPKPASVTMRQARLALLAAGKYTSVQPAINALSEPDKSKAQIEWDYSNEVHRDQVFVAILGAALGMDAAALDALFAQAAAL